MYHNLHGPFFCWTLLPFFVIYVRNWNEHFVMPVFQHIWSSLYIPQHLAHLCLIWLNLIFTEWMKGISLLYPNHPSFLTNSFICLSNSSLLSKAYRPSSALTSALIFSSWKLLAPFLSACVYFHLAIYFPKIIYKRYKLHKTFVLYPGTSNLSLDYVRKVVFHLTFMYVSHVFFTL